VETLALLGLGWLLVGILMTILWVVQRVRGDAGVVDVGWAAGLGLLAVLYALIGDGAPAYRLLVAVLAGLWSVRLALHVYFNRVRGKDEDGRYQTLRARWGEQSQSRFMVFFQAQALLAVLLSLPFVVIVNIDTPHLSVWAWVAIGVWAVAVTGETIADRQLAAFRADAANRGTTCRRGLWRYSRHPNYFFEWLHWWTYVVIAIGNTYWWATLVGPALMAFFLIKVTGIPATEAQALSSRGDDYRDYQRTTSAFVPWPPKK
jgi:steroid 5-alpha reductase family enzyme